MSMSSFNNFLNIFYSPDIETILSELGKNIKKVSVLKKTIILTPDKQTSDTIIKHIAMQNKVFAGFEFKKPVTFFKDLLMTFLDEDESLIRKEQLVFSIYNYITNNISEDEFSSVIDYLGNEAEKEKKGFVLSEIIADLFDQYPVHRPEMVKKWHHDEQFLTDDPGGYEKWQKTLYKEIFNNENSNFIDILTLKERLLSNFNKEKIKEKYPDGLSIFMTSSLPELFIEILEKFSEAVETNIYFLRSEKVNSFYNRLNKSGEHLFKRLCKKGKPHYLLPDKEIKDITKDNISINSCYSPVREIEVVYDYILDQLNKNKNLKLRDIIVLTPDINTYAPYFRAFSNTIDDDYKINFDISGDKILNGDSLENIFLKILQLYKKRFKFSEVFEILRSGAVLKKFNIKPDDLSKLKEFTHGAGFRWGIDEKSKEDLNLCPEGLNTWKETKKRLISGYAMDANEVIKYENIYPYGGAGGDFYHILGNFIDFVDKLINTKDKKKEKHTVSEWAELLFDDLEMFFDTKFDDDEPEKLIRNVLYKLNDKDNLNKISFEPVIQFIESTITDEIIPSKSFSESVKVSSLKNKSSSPAKLICLLGMNDKDFPSKETDFEMDLLKRKPENGDRNSKESDLYLFYEVLLSFREKLFISFIGKNIKNNRELLPSSLINDLMEWKNIKEEEIIKHPLHPFDPKYFSSENNLFSYSKKNRKISYDIYYKEQDNKPTKVREELIEIDEKLLDIKIDDLCTFFKNPAKYFMNKVLDIYYPRDEDELSDDEKFELDNLENYSFKDKISKIIQENNDNIKSKKALDSLRNISKIDGRIQQAIIGDKTFESLQKEVEIIHKKIKEEAGDVAVSSLAIDKKFEINENTIRIHGDLNSIYGNKQILFRVAKDNNSYDKISTYIKHLFFIYKNKTATTEKDPLTTIFITAKNEFQIDGKLESKNEIKKLLEIYFDGISNLIPFAPKFAEEFSKNSYEIAESKWTDDYNYQKDDYYFKRCFEILELFSENDNIIKKAESIANIMFKKIIEIEKRKKEEGKRKKKPNKKNNNSKNVKKK